MLVSIAVSSPQVSRVVIDQVFVQDLPESHVRPGHQVEPGVEATN